jgi:LmbE family N-acetylglucosaminyl deacetylase
MVVAHQDDEVLGAGGQFADFGRLSLLHVTDGAGFMPEARAKGFATLRDYASVRERELRNAVAATGVSARFDTLGVRGLEATFRMRFITRGIERSIAGAQPDIVLTHAYEGGHPDHDAIALAVRQAVGALSQPPPVWEFAGYHREGDAHVRGRFAPDGGPVLRLELSPEQRALKRYALDCFTSQQDVVAQFPQDTESFRHAPSYDFRQPPLERPLAYEHEGWGMSATLWLAAAREALAPRPDRCGTMRLRWEMWARRFHPDSPRVVRLMRRTPLLRAPDWLAVAS